jgi:hypothetical protein
MAVARNQRGALTQAGAGIAASRRKSGRFRAAIRVSGDVRGPIDRPGRQAEGTPMRNHIIRIITAIVLAVSLSGCALTARRTSVAELKYNPGRYEDRTVSIEGVVTSAWGIPLMPYRLYKVDDGTGEVTVISQSGRTPTKGARVRVKGRVNEVATLGGRSIGLHLQERDLDFRR